MNNKHLKNTTFDESLLGYAAAPFLSMAEGAVQNSYPQVKQDTAETEASKLDKPNSRKRVYLHSIGRFSNLKKLQRGTNVD